MNVERDFVEVSFKFAIELHIIQSPDKFPSLSLYLSTSLYIYTYKCVRRMRDFGSEIVRDLRRGSLDKERWESIDFWGDDEREREIDEKLETILLNLFVKVLGAG